MSKDKKNQDTQGKELSEWQKRNQEYLQKKAEATPAPSCVKSTISTSTISFFFNIFFTFYKPTKKDGNNPVTIYYTMN